jgi:hypothetical protein
MQNITRQRILVQKGFASLRFKERKEILLCLLLRAHFAKYQWKSHNEQVSLTTFLLTDDEWLTDKQLRTGA